MIRTVTELENKLAVGEIGTPEVEVQHMQAQKIEDSPSEREKL